MAEDKVRDKLPRKARIAQNTIRNTDAGFVGDGWLAPYFLGECYDLFRIISGDCQINGECDISFSYFEKYLGWERHRTSAKYNALVKMGLIIDDQISNRVRHAELDIDGVNTMNRLLQHVNKYGAWELKVYLNGRNIKDCADEILDMIMDDGRRVESKRNGKTKTKNNK